MGCLQFGGQREVYLSHNSVFCSQRALLCQFYVPAESQHVARLQGNNCNVQNNFISYELITLSFASICLKTDIIIVHCSCLSFGLGKAINECHYYDSSEFITERSLTPL